MAEDYDKDLLIILSSYNIEDVPFNRAFLSSNLFFKHSMAKLNLANPRLGHLGYNLENKSLFVKRIGYDI